MLPVEFDRRLKQTLYYGRNRYCPICESRLTAFLACSEPPRPDARCPVCGLVERHRMLWFVLRTHTDLFRRRGLSILHFAPELPFARAFARLPGVRYVTADIDPEKAMERVDIQEMGYADATFDVVLCCHVLEHIPNDRKGIGEIARVLKPGGWAALMVPVLSERTQEDPGVTDPEERERLYGQHDHLRSYGMDFAERVESCGLSVRAFRPGDVLGEDRMALMSVADKDVVFLCTKPR